MKKLKIVTTILSAITLLSIILTPAKFYDYEGYVRYPDYIIFVITIIDLVIIYLIVDKPIIQKTALVSCVLSAFYSVTTACMYIDGDFEYKSYRLKYVKIDLSDAVIKTFENLSFYSFILVLLVNLILIFYLFKRSNKVFQPYKLSTIE